MSDIVTAPSEVLSHEAKQVEKIDKGVLRFIGEMKQTLLNTRDPEGVGLAAPQVGKPWQLFITKPSRKSPVSVFINPKIVGRGEEKGVFLPKKKHRVVKKKNKKGNSKLEGCLSLPTIWGEVQRHQAVTLSYMDQLGKNHTKQFTGFLATIIQHEMDHLDGILFPRRVLEQKGKLYKSRKNSKGEDVFEEIPLP